MADTTGISSPQPSPEAEDVHKQDLELRSWLLVRTGTREFQPFWSESFDPDAAVTPAPPTKADNGWGSPFDLEGILEDVFSAVDTRVSQSSAKTQNQSQTHQSETPKSGASAT